MYAPSQAGNITGQTELHATLRGPLKNKAAVEAHVTVPVLQLAYQNKVQIGAAAPIHIDFVNNVVTLQRTEIRGTDTQIVLQGTVPLNSNAPASLLAQGTVDLQLAQLLNPDIASSGQLKLDVNSYGARADQNIQGEVRIVNANFATGDVPLGLENGNGVMTLSKDRLDIKQFTGSLGGGEVTARGGVIYQPSLRFDLAVTGNGLRMVYPDGVREAVSSNLTLTGTPEAATLGGNVNIDQLSFTRDFDLQNFIGQFSGETTAPPTGGFTQNLELNVGLHSKGGVNLSSRTLSLQGAANLQVKGTAAQPVILGRVNLNSGELFFMGNRYVLQGGTIDFVNPSQTQPVMNVSATTTIQEYNLQMQFQGPIDHLRTNYSSDPALPPADIINLLAFGKTNEASAANPSPAGTLGAQSLIASQVSSQVTNRLEKAAGISHLSVDPVLGGSGENPGARVTIQQRVTSNLYVTFGTDVTSTQRQVIQMEYKVSPRVSVSATRDQNGGFALDTRIHKTW
jgi:translocation and assembly module TamB